ncbi:MAG: hypothetical protein H0U90_06845 [Actinobacteria bacterium]|nr:hypothetical protein [Actinomycetota bacterium]
MRLAYRFCLPVALLALAAPGIASAAVASQVTAGVLVVASDGADRIAVGCSGGQVQVNGEAPDSGATACAAIIRIDVRGGPDANEIDLSTVSRTGFTNVVDVDVEGGEGSDSIRGSQLDDELGLGPGDDLALGGAGSDVLTGGTGDDTLDSSSGEGALPSEAEDLLGGAGDDTYVILAGGPAQLRSLVVSDSAGTDTLASELAVTVDLGSDEGQPQVIAANTTLLLTGEVENFDGSQGSDEVSGGEADNLLDGGGGADTLAGGDGDDVLRGGGGDDDLSGGDGDDWLDGGLRSDLIAGGNGTDTADYGGRRLGVTASLDARRNDGMRGDERPDGRRDWIRRDVENLRGGLGNDTLKGNNQRNRLIGGPGADRLYGLAGEDMISARDRRRDEVHGGPGTDTARVDPRRDRVRFVERLT